MIITRKKLTTILFSSLSLVLSALLSFKNERTICIYGSILVFIVGVLLFIQESRLSGGLLYYICLVFMHCGQMVMVALNWPFPRILSSSIVLGNGSNLNIATVKYTILSCLVSALVISSFSKKEPDTNERIIKKEEHALSSVEWSLILVIVFFSIISDFKKAIAVTSLGYQLGFRQTNTILYYADTLFPLTVFCVISAYKNNIKIIRIAYLFALIKATVSAFLIGTRSIAVLNILMFTYATEKLTSSTEIVQWVRKVFRIIILLGVIALPLSGLMRSNTVNGLADFIRNYNPISYSLTEFGGSIANVQLSSLYYGDKGMGIGDFIFSFFSILPLSSFFFPGIGGLYGNEYSSYINYRVGIIQGAGGFGGSVIGESVFWFGTGIFGLLYITLITASVMWCINSISNKNRFHDRIKTVALLFIIYEFFYQIRGTISSVQTGIKLSVYFLVFTFAIKHLFKKVRHG